MSASVPRNVLLSRAWRLKCPQCGESKMFHHWLVMHPTCSHCGLKYERDPGYFLGSIYVNYGITALTSTFVYITLHFGAEVSNWWLLPPLLAFCILFPIAFFPYARAYWLAMDLSFDKVNDEPDQPPPGYTGPV